MTNHEIRRLPVETGTSGWVAVSTRLAPPRARAVCGYTRGHSHGHRRSIKQFYHSEEIMWPCGDSFDVCKPLQSLYSDQQADPNVVLPIGRAGIHFIEIDAPWL
jgi:hypothetical protein